jgi:hypothetical protein
MNTKLISLDTSTKKDQLSRHAVFNMRSFALPKGFHNSQQDGV